MYGKEASNRKQEIDRQHHTIPNKRTKDQKTSTVEMCITCYSVMEKSCFGINVAVGISCKVVYIYENPALSRLLFFLVQRRLFLPGTEYLHLPGENSAEKQTSGALCFIRGRHIGKDFPLPEFPWDTVCGKRKYPSWNWRHPWYGRLCRSFLHREMSSPGIIHFRMGAGIVKCIQWFFRDAGQKVPVKEAYGAYIGLLDILYTRYYYC